MSIHADVMQRVYDSRTHLVIVNLWAAFEAILGVSLTTEHSIVTYLNSLGVTWPLFAAVTLFSLATLAFFLFNWLRSKYVFIGLIFFPLILYAIINLILVARSEAQADRIPLSIMIVGGMIVSWIFAELNDALLKSNHRLQAENAVLAAENDRLTKLQNDASADG